MPHCPRRESDLSGWADTLCRAPETNAAQWTCSDRDAVIGISAG